MPEVEPTGEEEDILRCAEDQFAASLMTELGLELEANNELKEGLIMYQAATKRWPASLIAWNNSARLLKIVEGDAIQAMEAYFQVVTITSDMRSREMDDAAIATLREDTIKAKSQAAGCAKRVVSELATLLRMAKTGFVGRSTEAGPPSEIQIAKCDTCGTTFQPVQMEH